MMIDIEDFFLYPVRDTLRMHHLLSTLATAPIRGLNSNSNNLNPKQNLRFKAQNTNDY
jgi:hypothetical protein